MREAPGKAGLLYDEAWRRWLVNVGDITDLNRVGNYHDSDIFFLRRFGKLSSGFSQSEGKLYDRDMCERSLGGPGAAHRSDRDRRSLSSCR